MDPQRPEMDVHWNYFVMHVIGVFGAVWFSLAPSLQKVLLRAKIFCATSPILVS
jgi:hypothetical protein